MTTKLLGYCISLTLHEYIKYTFFYMYVNTKHFFLDLKRLKIEQRKFISPHMYRINRYFRLCYYRSFHEFITVHTFKIKPPL